MACRVDTCWWVFFSAVPPRMLEFVESKTRLLLIGSLGALVLLAAATGAGALAIFARIRTGEAALRTDFTARSRQLERIRSGVYLSGTLVRDYFAAPNDPQAPELRSRLSSLERETTAAANHLSPNLRGEITAYWKVLHLMEDVAARPRSASMDDYFRRQMAQRRETMAGIAGAIGDQLLEESRRAESGWEALYRRSRWLLLAGVALVVVVGAAVAVGTSRRMVRLEADARSLAAQLVQAQEQERRAIARELHDEVGQGLSALLLDVGTAARLEDTGEIRVHLAAIAGQADRAVESVRRIALDLRPSMLDDLGLVAALEWQAREVGHRTGLQVEVAAEESDGQMPDAHRTCIYRVAQEALRNCARHAGATLVRIRLERSAASVSLRVEDDGKGFSPARSKGLGIQGMEERVAQLGGRLRVESVAGQGAVVIAELPV